MLMLVMAIAAVAGCESNQTQFRVPT